MLFKIHAAMLVWRRSKDSLKQKKKRKRKRERNKRTKSRANLSF